MGDWTFFSNYGHVLVCLARNREARLRDVASSVGITERAVQKIVRDLQDEGFLSVTKQGRCNRYRINRRKSLRHALEAHCTVGKLLQLVARAGASAESEEEARAAEPDHAEAQPGERKAVEPESGEQAAPERKKSRKQEAPGDTREQGSLF